MFLFSSDTRGCGKINNVGKPVLGAYDNLDPGRSYGINNILNPGKRFLNDGKEFLNKSFKKGLLLGAGAVLAVSPSLGCGEQIEPIPSNCVETATGVGQACLTPSSGTIENLAAINPSSLPECPDTQFPYGLFSYDVTGLTPGQVVEVEIQLPSTPDSETEYWVWGRTVGNMTDHWYRIPKSISGDVITKTLVDGGMGDYDLEANGVINTRGGPGNPTSEPLWRNVNSLESLLIKNKK